MDELIIKPDSNLLEKEATKTYESKEISSFDHSGLGPLIDKPGNKASLISVFNPKDMSYQKIYFSQIQDKEKQK